MTLRPADDTIQQRFLPVLSPQQRQDQFGLSGRGERFQSESERAFFEEDDVVEIRPTEETVEAPPRRFNSQSYNFQGHQNFQNGRYGQNIPQQTSPQIAATIYQQNELASEQPFHLGGGLDFVA